MDKIEKLKRKVVDARQAWSDAVEALRAACRARHLEADEVEIGPLEFSPHHSGLHDVILGVPAKPKPSCWTCAFFGVTDTEKREGRCRHWPVMVHGSDWCGRHLEKGQEYKHKAYGFHGGKVGVVEHLEEAKAEQKPGRHGAHLENAGDADRYRSGPDAVK